LISHALTFVVDGDVVVLGESDHGDLTGGAASLPGVQGIFTSLEVLDGNEGSWTLSPEVVLAGAVDNSIIRSWVKFARWARNSPA